MLYASISLQREYIYIQKYAHSLPKNLFYYVDQARQKKKETNPIHPKVDKQRQTVSWWFVSFFLFRPGVLEKTHFDISAAAVISSLCSTRSLLFAMVWWVHQNLKEEQMEATELV